MSAPKPAYLVARIEVTNVEAYRQYTEITPGIIKRYEGKFIVRGGTTTTLEGETESRRLVIIQFPSRQKAEAFYRSPEYGAAKQLRAGAATGQFLIVDGVAEQ